MFELKPKFANFIGIKNIFKSYNNNYNGKMGLEGE